MALEGFTIFSPTIFYPIWCLPCSRSIIYKIHLLFLFVLVFHFDFPVNLRFPNFVSLDDSNGVFWFSKWDRYGSYPPASFSSVWSAILKARTLSHIISWRNETERVFFPRKLPQQPSEQSQTIKLKHKCLFQRRYYRTSCSGPKSP